MIQRNLSFKVATNSLSFDHLQLGDVEKIGLSSKQVRYKSMFRQLNSWVELRVKLKKYIFDLGA